MKLSLISIFRILRLTSWILMAHATDEQIGGPCHSRSEATSQHRIKNTNDTVSSNSTSINDDDCTKRGITKTENDVGFNLLFQSNREEMREVPITFQGTFPPWLTGTLIRNGLGLFENGPRTFLHAFDGFAKLASWHFTSNGTVFFSTRFIRSAFYKSSVSSNTITAYLLFQSVSPPFGYFEKFQCLLRGIDNMNVNVYAFRHPKNKKMEYAALSDYWLMYKINSNTLSTKHLVTPRLKGISNSGSELQGSAFLNLLSSAHPLPEPGTNNYLTFLSSVAVFPWDSNVINLIRIKSLKRRKIIAQWPVQQIPYMHSFSVTQTKAILLASPLFVNVLCMARKAQPFACLDWKPNDSSLLYVVDLESGNLTTVPTTSIFTMHHINAYDITPDELIMDVSSYPNPDFVNHLQLHVLRDSAKRNSFNAHAKIKRLHINLAALEAYEVPVDSSPVPSLASMLDMPVINERYRSKHYCYIYGLVLKTDNKTLSKIAIVKKDMCNGSIGDKVWQVDGSYPVEPWFVPNPQGMEEDDGVLLVPALNGTRGVTYLAVLDAKTLSVLSHANMPTYIPYSLHGRFFETQ